MEINKKYNEFWSEFSVLSRKILDNPLDDETINKVDALVYDLGEFDWEYGPSKKREYYFALSPNLRLDLLDEVDKIVSLAPEMPDWEIISCKPKKEEELDQWSMLNQNEEEIEIDTTGWSCILYKFQDGTYEIDVKVGPINGDEDTKYTAVTIQLTNILGERKYLTAIANFKIVDEFSSEISNRSILVKDLDSYIS